MTREIGGFVRTLLGGAAPCAVVWLLRCGGDAFSGRTPSDSGTDSPADVRDDPGFVVVCSPCPDQPQDAGADSTDDGLEGGASDAAGEHLGVSESASGDVAAEGAVCPNGCGPHQACTATDSGPACTCVESACTSVASACANASTAVTCAQDALGCFYEASSLPCSGSTPVCVNGGCVACSPGTTQCSGNGVETCGSNGQWGNVKACPSSTPFCTQGGCTVPPSCEPGGPALNLCGPTAESCCASAEVAGGTYYRTYTNSGGGPTGEADPATVSSFRLDKYDVTVGRFRQFVAAWNNGAGYTAAAGSGKHTHLNGGQGLANIGSNGSYDTGWLPADNSHIAPTDTNLVCDSSYATWTSTAGNRETLPISCVNWYEAYAFCIWDGGFLPSEAEWEYAAAGGGQQREYPWGTTAPGTMNQYAIYGCHYPSGSTSCTGWSNIAPMGIAGQGAGAWSQFDLVGNMHQWNLDWWYPQSYVNPCTDCAYLAVTETRCFRGNAFNGPMSTLVPTGRNGTFPTDRFHYIGFRCARSP